MRSGNKKGWNAVFFFQHLLKVYCAVGLSFRKYKVQRKRAECLRLKGYHSERHPASNPLRTLPRLRPPLPHHSCCFPKRFWKGSVMFVLVKRAHRCRGCWCQVSSNAKAGSESILPSPILLTRPGTLQLLQSHLQSQNNCERSIFWFNSRYQGNHKSTTKDTWQRGLEELLQEVPRMTECILTQVGSIQRGINGKMSFTAINFWHLRIDSMFWCHYIPGESKKTEESWAPKKTKERTSFRKKGLFLRFVPGKSQVRWQLWSPLYLMIPLLPVRDVMVGRAEKTKKPQSTKSEMEGEELGPLSSNHLWRISWKKNP